MYLPFAEPNELASCLVTKGEANALWLLCVADCHADELPPLLECCRERGIRVCGGIFPGLIVGDAVRERGLIAIPLPAASRVVVANLSEEGVAWRSTPPALSDGQATSATILTDCLARNIAGLLEDIYDRYGNAVSYVGAGTGFHDLRAAPSIFTEQGMLSHAALLVLVPCTRSVRVRHGWTRIAGPFVASHTERNVIKELNWEPAGAFYRRQVESRMSLLAGTPVYSDLNSTFALCIAKEGCEDVMRDPTKINDDAEIVMLSDVAENSVMYLAYGDRASLIRAAGQAVDDLGLPGDVDACFVSVCYSRALMLGDDFSQELAQVRRNFAKFSDVTPEGVLALGEIAANGAQCIEFFNKTFVVALTHG